MSLEINKMFIPGTKFFRYIENQEEPEIIRILHIQKETKCPLIDRDATVRYFDSDGHKHDMKYSELVENYKMLRADGIIMFTIVEMMNEVKDVIIALQRRSLDNDPGRLPYAVCRQSIFDFFSNMTKAEDDKTYHVGISVSQDTCPADVNFADTLSCNKLISNTSISIYLDDTLDDILRYVKAKKYNEVLRELKQTSMSLDYTSGKVALGYCESLRELLTMNNFMYDFRQCFEIMELPFAIDEDSEGLDMNNILFMERELKVNIMETYLIRYTKEIDLRSIKRDYKLVTSSIDKCSKIYIVGYDKSDNAYVAR